MLKMIFSYLFHFLKAMVLVNQGSVKGPCNSIQTSHQWDHYIQIYLILHGVPP